MPKRKRKKKPLTLKDVLKANKAGKDVKPKRKKSKYKSETEKAREKLDKLSDKELKAYAEKAFKKAYMRLHRLKDAKNLSTAAKMHINEISGYINKKGEFDRRKKDLTREQLINKIIKADKFSSYKSTSAAGNKRQFEKEANDRGLTGPQYSNYQDAWDYARNSGLLAMYGESEFKEAIDDIIDIGANFDDFNSFYDAVKDQLLNNIESSQSDFDDIFGDDFDEPFTNPAFFD